MHFEESSERVIDESINPVKAEVIEDKPDPIPNGLSSNA